MGKSMSVSRLQTYADCSYAYKLRHIDQAPQRQAVWFIQGTAVHGALEYYERSMRGASRELVLAEFDRIWEEALAKAKEKQPDRKMWMVGGKRNLETDIQKRYEMGREQVLGYLEHHPPGEDIMPVEVAPGVPGLEVGFELSFGDVKVLGYIDCVMEERSSGRLFPEDWKTGREMPKDPYQLVTYKFALEELTGQTIEYARYWDSREQKYHWVDLRSYTREEVERWYKALVAGIDNEVFLPNPGNCFTCPVKPSCKYAS